MIVNSKTIRYKLANLIKNNLNIEFSLIFICKNLQDYKIKVNEKSHIP